MTMSCDTCWAKLLGALPVDVEQHVPTAVESPFDRSRGRTVAMAVDFGMFQQFTTLDHGVIALATDEMIVDPVGFA